MSATLNAYKRHAVLYGPEFVFEAAVSDLGAEDLAHLATALARVPGRWSPSGRHRDELAAALLELGWPEPRILKVPGIGQSSLARAHARASDSRNGHRSGISVPHPDFGGGSRYCAEPSCGQEVAGRADARYCSTACRVRAHRREGG